MAYDSAMDESQYLKLVDEALERAATWLEDFDPDEVDFSTTDGVVTIEFADGTRYVLNRQRAANQIWFAAGSRAWHYNLDESTGTWLDAKGSGELFANLKACVDAKLNG